MYFGFRKKRDCTVCVAKTKVLISCMRLPLSWSASLFSHMQKAVFFSHDVAHILVQYIIIVLKIDPCNLKDALRKCKNDSIKQKCYRSRNVTFNLEISKYTQTCIDKKIISD